MPSPEGITMTITGDRVDLRVIGGDSVRDTYVIENDPISLCAESHPPRMVGLGGGTGLSMTLRALASKAIFPVGITTVFDDGGSTGTLRKSVADPGLGDAGSCLSALSAGADLIRFRFEHGPFAGHPVKNLLVFAALQKNDGDLQAALDEVAATLNIRGRVVAVARCGSELVATLANGNRVRGEALIGLSTDIVGVELDPPIIGSDEAIETIRDADVLLVGPGSVITSILPCLAPSGIREAIEESKAILIGLANLTSQMFETTGWSADDVIDAIEAALGRPADVWLADGTPWAQLASENPGPGRSFIRPRRHLARCRLVDLRPHDRRPIHDPLKTAEAILHLWNEFGTARVA